MEVLTANEYDWQLDTRLVDGSLDISRNFCEGDSVHDVDVPNWVEHVAGARVAQRGSLIAYAVFFYHSGRIRIEGNIQIRAVEVHCCMDDSIDNVQSILLYWVIARTVSNTTAALNPT